MNDAVPFHFGFACVDLDAAVADHGRFGARAWLTSVWRQRATTTPVPAA